MPTMFDIAKRIMPPDAFGFIYRKKKANDLSKLMISDKNRFQNSIYYKYSKPSKESLSSWIMYCVHRIEKGLSHNSFRSGFGKSALTDLSLALGKWKEFNFSEDETIVKISKTVLFGYVQKHNSIGVELPVFFKELFPEYLKPNSENNSAIGGTRCVRADEKKQSETLSCREVMLSRCSVREFADSPLDKEQVIAAIELATRTPSVCNRQSWRVCLIESQSLIRSALDLQGGWKGYEYPPMLLLVTSDERSFMSISERNEPFVDGGIFLMSLLMALECSGIAACTLNAMFDKSREQKMRDLLSVPEHEALIAFVAVGNFRDSVLVPASTRYPLEHFVRCL